MTRQCNWKEFYRALGDKAPYLLDGLHPVLQDWIHEIAKTSDSFWSESLYELLKAGAAENNLKEGVLGALEEWCNNVKDYLRSEHGELKLPQQIEIRLEDAVIEELIEAARL